MKKKLLKPFSTKLKYPTMWQQTKVLLPYKHSFFKMFPDLNFAAIAICLMFLCASSAAQAQNCSISQTSGGDNILHVGNSFAHGQTFTACVTGVVDEVTFDVPVLGSGPDDINVHIRQGTTGATLATVPVNAAFGTNTASFLSQNVALTAGETYAIRFTSAGSFRLSRSTGNAYADGSRFQNSPSGTVTTFFDDLVFSVDILDGNVSWDIDLTSTTVDENEAIGTVVGTLSNADLDGDSYTYGISGADAASFSIDGNLLKTAEILNYESQSSYELTITSTDGDGNVFSEDFTITVGNVPGEVLVQYPFQGSLIDEAGSLDAVAYGSPTYGTDRFGRANESLVISDNNFARIDEFVLPFDPSTEEVTTAFSINLWFRMDATSADFQCVLDSRQNATPAETGGMTFGVNSSNELRLVLFKIIGGFESTLTLSSSSTVALGEWYMVTITRNMANEVQLLVDGVLIDSGTASFVEAGEMWNIGAQGLENRELNGAVDDIEFYEYVLSSSEIDDLLANDLVTWTGAVSSDWDDADNWDGSVPTITDDVLIASGTPNSPIVDNTTSALAQNVEVETGATLTLQSGGALAVYGDWTNNGTVQVERTITGNAAGLSIVSSPVTTMDISSLGVDYAHGYENATGFTNASSTAMVAGKGYFLGTDAGGATLTFDGTPNSGTVTHTVTESAGWELVGNPYTAAISISDFLGDNSSITGGVHFWDDGAANAGSSRGGDYISVTAMGTTAVQDLGNGVSGTSGSAAAANGYIGTAQGVFVEITNDDDLVFNTNQLVQVAGANSDANYYRVAEESGLSKIKLAIRGEELANAIIIGMHESATEGVDRLFDARKFPSDYPLAFYSMLGDEKYAQQALPLSASEVSLGFDLDVAGSYQLQVVSSSGLETQPTLIDYFTGRSYPLEEGLSVPFDVVDITKDNRRFSISFDAGNVLSTTSQAIEPSFTLWGNEQTLYIQHHESGIKEVLIYTMEGKVLYRESVQFDGNVQAIAAELSSHHHYVLSVGGQRVKFTIR